MKKKNEESEVKMQQKKVRAKRKFFLYAQGKGLVVMSNEANSMPTFNDGEALSFDTRAKAMFARDFFLKVNLAESIDILTKVA